MLELDMEIDDELIGRTKEEVEKSVTKELYDSIYAKMILSQVDNIGTEAECENRKKAIVKVLLASAWTQRLYFDIRSALMGVTGAIITFLSIWYLGTINLIQAAIIGIFIFAFSLFISRLFDEFITNGTKKIAAYLAKHKDLRNFILKSF